MKRPTEARSCKWKTILHNRVKVPVTLLLSSSPHCVSFSYILLCNLLIVFLFSSGLIELLVKKSQCCI